MDCASSPATRFCFRDGNSDKSLVHMLPLAPLFVGGRLSAQGISNQYEDVRLEDRADDLKFRPFELDIIIRWGFIHL